MPSFRRSFLRLLRLFAANSLFPYFVPLACFVALSARLDDEERGTNLAGMKYGITLVESDEGWAVWCDTLPGCCSQGATRAEALENIREAIAEYLAAKAAEIQGDGDVRSVQHEEVFV